ncbi:MAG: tetratricopeptide repeat protein, partial [bacterium]|nr:tetratricopeptide repeat protein [bacterium]
TSGHYYNLNQSSFDLGEVYENGIKKRLTATVEEGGQVKVWGEWFQLPLALGLLLLIVRHLRNTSLLKIFSKKTAPVVPVVLLLFIVALDISTPFNAIAEEEAAPANDIQSTYDESMREGIARFRKGLFNTAEQLFAEAETLTEDDNEKAIALFNRGNALAQLGKLEESLQVLQSARQLSPSDQEVIENISYLKKLIKSQNSPSEEKEQQEENEENKQNDGSSGNSGESGKSGDEQQENKQPGKEGKEENNGEEEKPSPENDSNESKNQPDEANDNSSDDKDSQQSSDGKDSEDKKGSGEQSQENQSSDEQQDTSSPENKESAKNKAGNKAENKAGKEGEEQNASANKEAGNTAEDNAEKIERGAAASSGNKQPDDKPLTSQLEAIIGGIEENTANYDNFRREQAIQILKEHYGSRVPEEDW